MTTDVSGVCQVRLGAEEETNTLNKPTLALVIIGIIFSLKVIVMLVDNLYGGIQFSNPRIHGISMMIAFWLPLIAFICCLTNPSRNVRKTGGWLLAPPAFLLASFSLLYLLYNYQFFTENRNIGIDFLHETIVDRAKVKVYHVGTTPTDPWDVVLQQEFKIFPGVIWVRQITRGSGADNVKIKVINKNTIDCTFMYGEHSEEGGKYHIL
ncbi:MAG: hypothetical protein QM758_23640 [Armatimonas sp.]